MNRPKPIVGQTLYSLNVGNAARGTPQVLTEVKVLKVGRTYFHAGIPDQRIPDQHWTLYRYRLNDWVQDQGDGYSGNSVIYLTRQEWEDEREATKHVSTIRSTFDTWTGRKLPLPVLRQIAALIDSVRA